MSTNPIISAHYAAMARKAAAKMRGTKTARKRARKAARARWKKHNEEKLRLKQLEANWPDLPSSQHINTNDNVDIWIP
jgi:hypothetical protein